MNLKKLMALYGIKWNPFAREVPVDGINIDDKLKRFGWQVENLVMDGGFAMITGPVGTGKSVSLRWLAHRLKQLQDVKVGEIIRPQSNLADFYRELSDLFGMSLQVSNRFNSFRSLREKWKGHIESTLFRPILLIDEAQEMLPVVLSELRLMSASQFDSRSIITVILCGDERLPEKFRHPDLLPLGSRIKSRLITEHKTKEDLAEIMTFLIEKAGNPTLMTSALIQTLADRSMGNYRAMMQMAENLLEEGLRRETPQLDDKLFLELFDTSKLPRTRRRKLN
jgi:type II secretory pathway predicted ATPase ExeA